MESKNSRLQNLATDGWSPDFLEWQSKDYGIGPEPPRYSLAWEDWIECRAMIAGLREGKEVREYEEALRHKPKDDEKAG